MNLDKVIKELKNKNIFTADDLDSLCNKYGFIYTQCDNEKNGEFCEGITTYQIQEEDGYDYFGEFVGDDENGYEFVEYDE